MMTLLFSVCSPHLRSRFDISHSLIHGRPFPLKGEYFANIFIHFEPTGKVLRERDAYLRTDTSGELPIYIMPGSPEEKKWLRENKRSVKEAPAAAPLNPLAHASATGDIATVAEYAATKSDQLHKPDNNGWTSLHEAARGGHQNVVALLVKHGADVNQKTNFGEGDTALDLAVRSHGRDHPLVRFLQLNGAIEGGSEL
mmetsp:Transcript_4985/g.11018  ORF Transcript_4985/g.11018 Transcript_4985/m.11018 type:complete len:198 (+) Transcript_4985:2856-3449(+)